MKFLAPAFLLLLWTTQPSHAQSVSTCFTKIGPLAKRLNVRPDVSTSMMVITSCDGHTYDLLALINALLDRMDKAEKGTRK